MTDQQTATDDHTVDEHSTSEATPQRVICVAVDYSNHSENAVEWTVQNLATKGSDLIVLLNVRPDVIPTPPYGTIKDVLMSGMGYVDVGDAIAEMERAVNIQTLTDAVGAF